MRRRGNYEVRSTQFHAPREEYTTDDEGNRRQRHLHPSDAGDEVLSTHRTLSGAMRAQARMARRHGTCECGAAVLTGPGAADLSESDERIYMAGLHDHLGAR